MEAATQPVRRETASTAIRPTKQLLALQEQPTPRVKMARNIQIQAAHQQALRLLGIVTVECAQGHHG